MSINAKQLRVTCSVHGRITVENDGINGRSHLMEGHSLGDYIKTTNGLTPKPYYAQLVEGFLGQSPVPFITSQLADVDANRRAYEKGYRQRPDETRIDFMIRAGESERWLQELAKERGRAFGRERKSRNLEKHF